MRNLNDIFKTNNRKAQRAILDKFDISKEDKNKTLNSLANTNGGGSVSKYAPRYFKIDFSKAGSAWETILSITDIDDAVKDSDMMLTIGALYKIEMENHNVIYTYPFINIESNWKYSFSYMPLYVTEDIARQLGISSFLTFEGMLENICKILVLLGKVDSDGVLSTDGITEITEEEFYKID